ncbi:uncharacterized protein G2W53_021236 [Senna tora]|uniref:Uncharacterized protein n=1 Tax=Senna tora TaxID=362788 RepID=A0A834TJ06_9FABA|nr:uncharacterized protein G2W53_021236 [Senna tora]
MGMGMLRGKSRGDMQWYGIDGNSKRVEIMHGKGKPFRLLCDEPASARNA